MRHVIEANLQALGSCAPRPYPERAVMLLSRDEPDRAFYDGRLGWADLVEKGLVVRFIPGNHENMLDEPTVQGGRGDDRSLSRVVRAGCRLGGATPVPLAVNRRPFA